MVAQALQTTREFDHTPKRREYSKRDLIEHYLAARSELHGFANYLDNHEAEAMADQLRMVLQMADAEYGRLKRCTNSTR